jgi:glycerophosphoryl diester phosphodiesterase
MRRYTRSGCLTLFILIVFLYYGSYFVLRDGRTPDPALIAHRGAHRGQSGQLPENTMAAFQNAAGLGVDWLEMDVQMTKDGHLVVIHDKTVNRTTNGTGPVAELTLAEIRALDAGQGEQIPTFQEVLDFSKESGIPILPETKLPQLYPGMAEKMATQIVEANHINQTVVQSFEPTALENIRAVNPDISVCALHGLFDFHLGDPQPGEADIVAPMAEMVVLYPWMIKQAHAAGHQVFVWFWSTEHPLMLRLLLALGADGLMVDDPLSLARELGR